MADPLGKVTLWSSTQIPFFLRRNLATALDIHESKVRVIKPKVGEDSVRRSISMPRISALPSLP